MTIIYEDRASGLIAKRFSDMLISSLGREVKCTLSCWRSELIDLPEVADEIARDAAASDFVILSLRGDSRLSMATRVWIGTWLAGAVDRPACLVALFDPERSLFMSGNPMQYRRLDPCYFVGKPFIHLDTLLKTIRDALNHRRSAHQPDSIAA